MKVVSVYRPFTPESLSHHRLGPFDWQGALRMLGSSVRASCGCETVAITDVDTTLQVPAYQYRTAHRRLMLWILEVSLRYLESSDFDCDTVMISPDTLVYGDLRPFFVEDLGLIVRPQEKYRDKPILNGVQWWAHRAKARLIAFYRDVLRLAEGLEEGYLRWGGDTKALVNFLAPIVLGPFRRGDLTVYGFNRSQVMDSGSLAHVDAWRRAGVAAWPSCPVVDFKHLKKQHMAAFYAATYGRKVA